MDSITSSRMNAIDANCSYLGLKGIQLMENAGAAIAREAADVVSDGEVLIVAGRGNNGGDGFVAARHLSAYQNLKVKIILTGKPDTIRTEDARANFNLLKHCDIGEIRVFDNSPAIFDWFGDADVIIDALLGTGVKGNIREPESTLIDLINSSNAKVIAVDTPSGVDPDSGNVSGKAVKADTTLTFHRMKTGLENPDAKDFTGEVKVIPIGVCMDAESDVGRGDLKLIANRKSTSHKGDSGRILIIGGGAYSGAPALAAMAALRTGADIVTVAAPASVAKTIASFSPNLIVRELTADRLCPEDIPILEELISAHDVTVMGMGLGREKRTLEAVKQIIPLCRKLVLDADALYDLELPASLDYMILTPHAGEFRKLAGTIPETLEKKIDFVNEFSIRENVTTLLKGSSDIISDGKQYRINKTGNPGMTVGGTGDVLAGIVGALFALYDAIDAAGNGAFINGAAGDLAFVEKGYGLVATDIIEKIPKAIMGRGTKHD
ncbi:NAD(P)H-hydrate epimerase [Methanohalophilus levihalophilus]|uniref:NAD(P)H-hydrate dehydratase n=1 Tax=Methanohalophilus levihalophilus TaxID=1431282 RepID=UPI001AE5D8ED|nr:NAD(P)H-hydrate dehydratase [Methanohalophilus levihalophilus]MBP2030617.1 NAD(P)H-hydrate epimerase [Methanohalophilus levihalophilus]